jgi:hypothetical protein
MQNDEIEKKKTHKIIVENKSEPIRINSTNPPLVTWDQDIKKKTYKIRT